MECVEAESFSGQPFRNSYPNPKVKDKGVWNIVFNQQ
jgi:hypothetical protein